MEQTMIAPASERVRHNTASDVNEAIDERTRRDVAYFRAHPAEVPHRLGELEREWDVERALATASSCLSLLGLALGGIRRRRWLLLPLVVQSFYLQHTLQGWCPPLPALRRLGFRTPREIDDERCELEAIARERDAYGDEPASSHGGERPPVLP
ncbi:MAG TPA: hypothetical protein VFD92_16310 [Candidatus Binatia bacterium]|nr:hypothetical protein [Candidatus Binatia bacterium]